MQWRVAGAHLFQKWKPMRSAQPLRSARRFSTQFRSTGRAKQSSTCLLPLGIVGGIAAVVYTRRAVHSEAYVKASDSYVYPEAKPSVRLRILHEQAAQAAQALDESKQRVQTAQSGLTIRIIRLVAADWLLLVGVAVTAVGAAVVGLWMPVVVGDVVDAVARGARLVAEMDASVAAALRAPARRLLALAVANGLLTFAHTTLVAVLGERVGARLHAQALAGLLRHDISYFDTAQAGAVAARVAADVAEAQTTLKRVVTQGLKAATLAGGAAWQLARAAPALALTLGAAGAVVYAALAAYGRVLRQLRRDSRDWEALAAGVASEAVLGVRTVRALGADRDELALFGEARAAQAASATRFGLHMGAFSGVATTAAGVSVLGVLYRGARLVARGEMAPGDLVAFLLAAQAAQRALDSLSALLGQTVRARAAVARVLEMADLPAAPGATGARLDAVQGHVRFMDVDFTYPARDAPVLHRFNLDVPAGHVVALCGASGSGKSTVAALLERFYEPSGGEIWLDACPLRRLDATWLREQIGYIPQDPVLFSTSVRENVRMAQPTATDDEVEHACRLANAHDFVSEFPRGYDTVVGARGAQLSGGQRQRLSIARAILRDPRILVLDEATSALDAESERLVQTALDRLMVGRTVLIIAHRLSTIRHADRIVVMGAVPGHIVEQGTHEELLQQQGAYHRLYHAAETSGKGL
ncbi:hypothetical protein IWW46_000375 [Coemansia sp. RSA 2440]|nr:hypothetical protein IWW46_000375 [Coemansia sp. RSA 2440]